MRGEGGKLDETQKKENIRAASRLYDPLCLQRRIRGFTGERSTRDDLQDGFCGYS